MKISRIILRVSDLNSSRAFWVDNVGLTVKGTGGDFVFLDAEYEEMRQRNIEFLVEPRPVTSEGDRDLLATRFRDPDGHLASITGWVAGT